MGRKDVVLSGDTRENTDVNHFRKNVGLLRDENRSMVDGCAAKWLDFE